MNGQATLWVALERGNNEGNDMTYDGPVPIPGTLKSKLAPYYVSGTFTKAWALWWKNPSSVHKPRYQVEWPYPEKQDN